MHNGEDDMCITIVRFLKRTFAFHFSGNSVFVMCFMLCYVLITTKLTLITQNGQLHVVAVTGHTSL